MNNSEKSIVALIFMGWLDMWFMPLFFLLSGVGSWYALQSRNNGQYVLERIKRILIPLYTVGLFLLLPPQYYFEILSHAGYRGTFWDMFPRYFIGYNPGDEPFSLSFVIFETAMSIGRLTWIIFVLSIGAKHLNFNNNVLVYGNEAVLPFYIFHQTIILCVGWFVISWDIGILSKYLIIAVASFVLIMAVYEGIVRRLNTVRYLFGMRSKT